MTELTPERIAELRAFLDWEEGDCPAEPNDDEIRVLLDAYERDREPCCGSWKGMPADFWTDDA